MEFLFTPKKFSISNIPTKTAIYKQSHSYDGLAQKTCDHYVKGKVISRREYYMLELDMRETDRDEERERE